jgi:RHS repeat-associated protein
LSDTCACFLPLFKRRSPGADGQNLENTTALGAGPGQSHLFGRVSYLHAGGIDRPLTIWKEGMGSVLPHQNWRGLFSRGTWGYNSMGAVGTTANCVTINVNECLPLNWPGERTTAWHESGGESELWMGGLVDGMRDPTGQIYMRNRYYNPQTGQFTQMDPIGIAGGLNAYGFAAGDPVSYSDPYGLCSTLINTATGESQAGPTSCKLATLVVTATKPNGFIAGVTWLWRAINTDLCPECSKGVADFGLVGGVGLIRSLGGAANVPNGPRLRAALTLDEATSVFTNSGQLRGSVVSNSTEIIRGSQLNNPAVVAELTRDGSNIADWGKYTTDTFNSPAGAFQVHFYRNRATGQVNYNVDYKVKFNTQ